MPQEKLADYRHWLRRQPLAANTRRTYEARVAQFCEFLVTLPCEYGDPLRDTPARDYAVRDYKSHLKIQRQAQPTSVNLTLAALDNFYRFLELGTPQVRREDLPQVAPRALEPEEQKRFLRAVEQSPSPRDQAIALLLFYTALRLGECAALTIDDIFLTARKGKVIVRAGKGDAYREVLLNAQAREALDRWLQTRKRQVGETSERALFVNLKGQRLTPRAMEMVVHQIGEKVGLLLSPHILRHTCLTNLVRNGSDLVLVAEIAGHKRLETTRRYSLPSLRDREAAMESLQIDY
jgi:integrase/recombinase XerC